MSSDPETMRLLLNCKQVMTWSSCPFNTFGVRIPRTRQLISILCCRINPPFHGEYWKLVADLLRFLLLKFIMSLISSERPASRHFSLQSRLSSAKIRQYRHVWAARSKSRGWRKDRTYKASSFGNNEIKSRWNCGSITDIICRTWVGWHLVIMSWLIATRLSVWVQEENISNQDSKFFGGSTRGNWSTSSSSWIKASVVSVSMAKSKQVQNVTIYNIYNVDCTCSVQFFFNQIAK